MHKHSHQHNHQQLQKQVKNLQRLIRIQNQVIIGLFSCFVVLIIICSVFVLQHLPDDHPNDDSKPFWLQHNNIIIPIIPKQAAAQLSPKVNCSSFGCSLRPVELVQLNELQMNSSNHYSPLVASPNHIILTYKSNRKKPAPVNQDRSILIPSFSSGDNSILIKEAVGLDARDNFFLGLFDGHDDNGHTVAQFASEEIPSRIAMKLQAQDVPILSNRKYSIQENNHTISTIKDIITSAYIEVDKLADPGGGCTALTVFRRGSTLFMSNTGDSTAFLVVYTPPDEQKTMANEKYLHSPRSPDIQLHLQGTITIHHQNLKHKAHFPDEYDRITDLGGKVHIPPKNAMGSRVIVRSSLHREDVGLAMSRSIGDWEWTAVGVIPNPDTMTVDLNKFWTEHVIKKNGQESKVFAVLGSDGLFDARQPLFVASHLAYAFFEYDANQYDETKIDQDDNGSELSSAEKDEMLSKHVVEVGKKLMQMASPLKEEWYRDDITFVSKIISI